MTTRHSRHFRNGEKVRIPPRVRCMQIEQIGMVTYEDYPEAIKLNWINILKPGEAFFTIDGELYKNSSIRKEREIESIELLGAPSNSNERELLSFFKNPQVTKCLLCGAPGEDLVFKFLCSSSTCQNYRR